MPTVSQLQRNMMFEFLHGKDIYSETTNGRGSAYVGRTRGWLSMQAEERENRNRNRRYSIHKKYISDTNRLT